MLFQISNPTFCVLGVDRRVPPAFFAALFLVPALSACEQPPPPVAEQIRALKTITVTEVASGQSRKYSGIVEATDTSILSFQVSGNVQQVRVDLGDQVTKDQVLAVLDTKPYELNLQAAEAELQNARANHEERRLEFNRQKTLFEKGWVSEAAYDQALSALESGKASVNYAVSKVNLAKRDLSLTTLKAPFSGVIALKQVDPFAEVRAGQKLFEINADGAKEVGLNIPETTIAEIAIGMPVSVAFPTEKGLASEARVSEIGSVAGDANSFPVKAGLLDPPLTVRAGMTAEVTFVLKEENAEAGYLIPLSAIFPGDEPRQGYVFVYDPETSTVNRAPVRGRGATENMIVIYQGVTPGDIIAVAGVSFLTDGQKVKLLDR